MNNELPPPVGEDSTALVLHVLRETIRTHEQTIAALLEDVRQLNVTIQALQSGREIESRAWREQQEQQHTRISQLIRERRRWAAEMEHVVTALRNLVTALRSGHINIVGGRTAMPIIMALDQAHELLRIIDQRASE
jgi:hypothetical protein